MPLIFARLCLAILCCLYAACGGQNGGLLQLEPAPDSTGPSPYVTGDPQGPISEPSIPADLAAMAAPQAAATPDRPQPASDEKTPSGSEGTEKNTPSISYSVTVVSPDTSELESPFRAMAHLEVLRDRPLLSVMGLNQRMRSDLETGQDVLHSFGYYAGKVRGEITQAKSEGANDQPGGGEGEKSRHSNEYVVVITFEPGIQYTVGKTKISLTEPEMLHLDDPQPKRPAPARTLADVNLPEGSPALAGNVLDAVSAVRENFRDRGYPFASVSSSRYVVDHSNQTLDVDLVIDSGPLVTMNGLEIKGESPVRRSYLDALTTWKPGEIWNQSKVESFRNTLRQSGLFSAADLDPAEIDDENGRRAVVAELTEAPPRTVGGALKYDTDFGPGLQAYWEHRNITGRGDRLRLEAPVWADLQELIATYRLPFFFSDKQDFTARAAYRKEDTDAYDLTSYMAAVGIERRLSRRWTGSVNVHIEGGELKDPDEARTEYLMMGLPLSLHYNGANSLLDATRGVRLNLAAAPYTGEYHGDFTVVRSRVEAQAFLPLVGENSLVLALRAMYGVISDTNAQDVPASLRFYTGGGGSVRGYEYQSLGPRNDSRDPLGGASAVELSAETRVRFTDTWGMVAFVDGGMAYADAAPDFSEQELRWGAGLGIRVYTAIGPIRLDVATPLNPRSDDNSIQFYFSIGQSF